MNKYSLCVLILLNIYISTNNASAQNRFLETEGVGNIIYDTTFTYGTEEKVVQIPKIIDLATNPEFSQVVIRNKKIGTWTRCNLPLKSKIGLTGSVNRQLAFKCKPMD